MKTPRHFTYQEIVNEFNARFGKLSDLWQVKSIHFLPELTPPTWVVSYTVQYDTWVSHDTLLFLEKQDHDLDKHPYLNGPIMIELPEGAASVQEEDAELERQREASRQAMRRRKDAAQS